MGGCEVTLTAFGPWNDRTWGSKLHAKRGAGSDERTRNVLHPPPQAYGLRDSRPGHMMTCIVIHRSRATHTVMRMRMRLRFAATRYWTQPHVLYLLRLSFALSRYTAILGWLGAIAAV